MTTYRLTPEAQKDLSFIWEYTHETRGQSQAQKYIRGIQEAIQRVAKDPMRGHLREEVHHDLRSYAIGTHVLFYRPTTKGIDVLRILHQRMDPNRNL